MGFYNCHLRIVYSDEDSYKNCSINSSLQSHILKCHTLDHHWYKSSTGKCRCDIKFYLVKHNIYGLFKIMCNTFQESPSERFGSVNYHLNLKQFDNLCTKTLSTISSFYEVSQMLVGINFYRDKENLLDSEEYSIEIISKIMKNFNNHKKRIITMSRNYLKRKLLVGEIVDYIFDYMGCVSDAIAIFTFDC